MTEICGSTKTVSGKPCNMIKKGLCYRHRNDRNDFNIEKPKVSSSVETKYPSKDTQLVFS